MIADASIIFALLNRRDQHHEQARAWFELARPSFATTPLVIAEVDFLAGRRGGIAMRAAFHGDVRAGAYSIQWWEGAAAQAAEIADGYADLGVSLADASLVALADRLRTIEIATFDERHFRALRPPSGGAAFRLLPGDAG
jgi:predicted nucleic acid-binding protein